MAITFSGLVCLPGGIIKKGGYSNGIIMQAAATNLGDEPFDIVCPDLNKISRKKNEPSSGLREGPPTRLVSPKNYSGGCEQSGRHSVFYLFHMFPITPPLKPEYALGLPVQDLEGDTMINIIMHHETHYYSILGRVSVLVVRGDVIRFRRRKILPTKKEKKAKKK